MNDPGETVKGGQSWGGRVLKIGEDVVLDDDHPRLVCDLQQSVRDDGGEDRAGRIVKGGIRDVQARSMFG